MILAYYWPSSIAEKWIRSLNTSERIISQQENFINPLTDTGKLAKNDVRN